MTQTGKLPTENGWSYRFIWISHVICCAMGVMTGLAISKGIWGVLVVLVLWLTFLGFAYWPDNRTA